MRLVDPRAYAGEQSRTPPLVRYGFLSLKSVRTIIGWYPKHRTNYYGSMASKISLARTSYSKDR